MLRYFAYGSNLNQADLDRWSQRTGRPFALTGAWVPAFLPDHDMVFDFSSASRHGGVPDLRPAVGKLVPGALFDVAEEDLETLDIKEGVPHIYRRAEKRVLVADGREVAAVTYEVAPENRSPQRVQPTEAYVELVAAGLAAYGQSDRVLRAAAAGQETPFLVTCLFAYGTLLTGGSRHDDLERGGGVAGVVRATASGFLLDCGAFPGMLPGPGGTVHGELIELRDPGAAFPHLDGVRGFEGFDAARALFRRALVTVRTSEGSRRLAWSYLWAGNANHPRVPSGDWVLWLGARQQT